MQNKCHPPGKIIPNGVHLEQHEYDTVLFFTELGKDIELIFPPRTPHIKVADFIMDGLIWETKSPNTNTHKSIERTFYNATSQSQNIILDLRRLKGSDADAIHTLEKCFKSSRKSRHMLIINKGGALQKYKK